MIFKAVLTLILAMNAVLCVLGIGKPRRPIDPPLAASVVVVNTVICVGLWVWT